MVTATEFGWASIKGLLVKGWVDLCFTLPSCYKMDTKENAGIPCSELFSHLGLIIILVGDRGVQTFHLLHPLIPVPTCLCFLIAKYSAMLCNFSLFLPLPATLGIPLPAAPPIHLMPPFLPQAPPTCPPPKYF